MIGRATRLKLGGGGYRDVDYNHDPPDEDCPKCIIGCENCDNGIIPWEWSIDWYALAAGRES